MNADDFNHGDRVRVTRHDGSTVDGICHMPGEGYRYGGPSGTWSILTDEGTFIGSVWPSRLTLLSRASADYKPVMLNVIYGGRQ
jgi:hypothetical protein